MYMPCIGNSGGLAEPFSSGRKCHGENIFHGRTFKESPVASGEEAPWNMRNISIERLQGGVDVGRLEDEYFVAWRVQSSVTSAPEVLEEISIQST